MTRLRQLLVGPVAPLGAGGVPSGIDKRAVAGRVWLGHAGFAGDAQGDRRHHGGPEKAVHHYPFEHYALWRDEIGMCDLLSRPGAFGENVSTIGLAEADVAVGDTFRVGGALIQVSQGRQPCWKLDRRFGVPGIARRVQRNGWTGWYHRVLEEGHVGEGDEFVLVDRPAPAWTIERLWRALHVDTLNLDELAVMATLPHLADGWRRCAAQRIATRRVEDWSARLDGPSA